ncbi:hypothetical protein BD413DRAFT_301139 [Trametes elegans]|nr:hypothetical protein BD413DRAFT_301139 [Trametes elegans]
MWRRRRQRRRWRLDVAPRMGGRRGEMVVGFEVSVGDRLFLYSSARQPPEACSVEHSSRADARASVVSVFNPVTTCIAGLGQRPCACTHRECTPIYALALPHLIPSDVHTMTLANGHPLDFRPFPSDRRWKSDVPTRPTYPTVHRATTYSPTVINASQYTTSLSLSDKAPLAKARSSTVYHLPRRLRSFAPIPHVGTCLSDISPI